MSLGLNFELWQYYYKYGDSLYISLMTYKNHRIKPVVFTCNIVLTIAVEDGVFNKYIVYFANCL